MEILADLQSHATWRFADKEALIADISRHIHALPGVPTKLLASHRGQRRGGAVRREGRDRGQAVRAGPGGAGSQGRAGGGHPALDPGRRRRRSRAHRRPERTRYPHRPRPHRPPRLERLGRQRGDPGGARRHRGRPVLRSRSPLRPDAPPGGKGPGVAGRHRRAADRLARRRQRKAGRRGRDRHAPGRGAREPRGWPAQRLGQGQPAGPRPGQLRRRGAAEGGGAGDAAARLPHRLGRPVREPAARRQAPARDRAGHRLPDLRAAVRGVPLGPAGVIGADDRAVHADRRAGRPGPGRACTSRSRRRSA